LPSWVIDWAINLLVCLIGDLLVNLTVELCRCLSHDLVVDSIQFI